MRLVYIVDVDEISPIIFQRDPVPSIAAMAYWPSFSNVQIAWYPFIVQYPPNTWYEVPHISKCSKRPEIEKLPLAPPYLLI